MEERIAAALDAGALGDAATLIINSYGPGLLGYLAAVLRDEDAAREAFSELGEELWKALPRFQRRSSARTWAYGIAYRCALRHRRRTARRRTRPLRDSEYSRLAASIATVSRSLSRTAAERKVDELRRTLSPGEQSLLVLRLDRKMDWDEIAGVLGTTPPTVRKRFQRLKERLRRSYGAATSGRGAVDEP